MIQIGPECCEGGIRGYGVTNSVMFIGIAPGADEWRTSRKPFTGQSGYVLTQALKAVGIDRDAQAYCTNLICWWNDTPSPEDIAVCAPRLRAEILQVQPSVIVLLGKLACESILGMPFKKAQGAVIQKDNVTYLCTYHPAAALHKGKTTQEKEQQINAAASFCRDIAKLPNLLMNPKHWPEPKYTIINSPVQAQQFLNGLSTTDAIAIDIETNYDKEYEKEHPFDHDITCIGIGDSDHAYVLTQSALTNLEWPNCHWLFHNGMFDTQEIARRFGVWLTIGEDTMLQSYSVDERGVKNNSGLHHKLKNLAREYAGSDFYEEDDHKLSLEDPDSYTRLYEYNAKDVVYTYRLHQHFNEWQEREQVTGMYRSLLLPLANMLARAQYRGIYVNRQYLVEVFTLLTREYLKVQQQLLKFNVDVLGFPEFNVDSPKQVKALLEIQGYPVADTRKATLQDLLDSSDDEIPFINLLLRHRQVSKLLRDSVRDIDKQVKYDGRVHPHAFPIGTVSGRLTYRAPAMNTLPKDKTVKDLGVVRKIFSATNDDYVLLEVDYAAIEGWLGAFFSEDDILLHDLQSGDWHSSVATDMFHVTPETATDRYQWLHLRDAAKHINYGSFFGEGAQGLTRRPPIGIGCDLRTAQNYLRLWKAHYPKFVKYQQSQIALARNVGVIVTPFGRKRRFPMHVSDHQDRQAINYKIQSTASDYALSSAIRLRPQLAALDTHLLFIEHDALYYEVYKRNLPEVLELIRYEMERPPLPELPSIKVEIDVGPNLAELARV